MNKNRGVKSAPQPVESGYATAGVPISGGPVVSEIIPVPEELGDWLRGPKFQPVLLKVKEQTGINYFTLNKDPNDGTMQLWIYSPSPERARMARLLVDVNFKQQMKLNQAESHLKQIQSDLSNVQSEVVSGLRIEFRSPAELIGLMIGKGGARIKEIIESTGVKTINMSDNGKVTIVGTNAENAQRARALFELIEDFSVLSEEESNHLMRDYSSLNDLKTSAGLLVARLEMKPSARIVYIGTQDAISCAKVVLTTQLDYLKRRIQLLSDEQELRQELSSYRAGAGGGFGGRGGRGGDSLHRMGGRGDSTRRRPAPGDAPVRPSADYKGGAKAADKPAAAAAAAAAVAPITQNKTAKSQAPVSEKKAEKPPARGVSLRDSLQQMAAATSSGNGDSSKPAAPAGDKKAKKGKQPAEPAAGAEPSAKPAPAAAVKTADAAGEQPSSAAKKKRGKAKAGADTPPEPPTAAVPAAPEGAKKEPKAPKQAAKTVSAPPPGFEPPTQTAEAVAAATPSKRKRKGGAATETQDSLVTALSEMAISTEVAKEKESGNKGKGKAKSDPAKPAAESKTTAPAAAVAAVAVKAEGEADALPKRATRSRAKKATTSEENEKA